MISDLVLLRNAINVLHQETCDEGGHDFEMSKAGVDALAAINRLEAARCLNCKHWTDEHPNSPGMRMCWKLTESGNVDTIDSMATLHTTKPDFGCVLWEGKSEK